jgi:hypothetical protein
MQEQHTCCFPQAACVSYKHLQGRLCLSAVLVQSKSPCQALQPRLTAAPSCISPGMSTAASALLLCCYHCPTGQCYIHFCLKLLCCHSHSSSTWHEHVCCCLCPVVATVMSSCRLQQPPCHARQVMISQLQLTWLVTLPLSCCCRYCSPSHNPIFNCFPNVCSLGSHVHAPGLSTSASASALFVATVMSSCRLQQPPCHTRQLTISQFQLTWLFTLPLPCCCRYCS